MSWTAYKIRLHAEIQLRNPDRPEDPPDAVRLEIGRCACSYPLNDRPRCSLLVAVGRRADTQQRSSVHNIIARLRRRQRITVRCQVQRVGGSGVQQELGFPRHAQVFGETEDFVLFDGHVAGVGQRRGDEAAAVMLSVDHWTADLAHASATCSNLAPDSPDDLAFNTVIDLPNEGPAANVRGNFLTGPGLARSIVVSNSLATDYWGLALRPFLRRLASARSVFSTSPLGAAANPALTDRGNVEALAALARFEPRERPRAAALYNKGVPTAITTAGPAGSALTIAANIADAHAVEDLTARLGQTLWDKLLVNCSSLLLGIVPLPLRALVVPLFPGLRRPWRIIQATQDTQVELSGSTPRLLRAVALYQHQAGQAGAQLQGQPGQPPGAALGLCGVFAGDNSGVIVFREAPRWLARLNSSRATFSFNRRQTRPTATTGDRPTGNDALAAAAAAAIAQQARASQDLLSYYARALYVVENLRFRQGVVSGPFRMDIAPGSTVGVDSTGEPFIVGDQLSERIFASVQSVEHVLDAVTGQAGTTLQLAYVRTESENNDDRLSLDRHPLWQTPWLGCELRDSAL